MDAAPSSQGEPAPAQDEPAEWPRVELPERLVPSQRIVDEARGQLLNYLDDLRRRLGLPESPH